MQRLGVLHPLLVELLKLRYEDDGVTLKVPKIVLDLCDLCDKTMDCCSKLAVPLKHIRCILKNLAVTPTQLPTNIPLVRAVAYFIIHEKAKKESPADIITKHWCSSLYIRQDMRDNPFITHLRSYAAAATQILGSLEMIEGLPGLMQGRKYADLSSQISKLRQRGFGNNIGVVQASDFLAKARVEVEEIVFLAIVKADNIDAARATLNQYSWAEPGVLTMMVRMTEAVTKSKNLAMHMVSSPFSSLQEKFVSEFKDVLARLDNFEKEPFFTQPGYMDVTTVHFRNAYAFTLDTMKGHLKAVPKMLQEIADALGSPPAFTPEGYPAWKTWVDRVAILLAWGLQTVSGWPSASNLVEVCDCSRFVVDNWALLSNPESIALENLDVLFKLHEDAVKASKASGFPAMHLGRVLGHLEFAVKEKLETTLKLAFPVSADRAAEVDPTISAGFQHFLKRIDPSAATTLCEGVDKKAIAYLEYQNANVANLTDAFWLDATKSTPSNLTEFIIGDCGLEWFRGPFANRITKAYPASVGNVELLTIVTEDLVVAFDVLCVMKPTSDVTDRFRSTSQKLAKDCTSFQAVLLAMSPLLDIINAGAGSKNPVDLAQLVTAGRQAALWVSRLMADPLRLCNQTLTRI